MAFDTTFDSVLVGGISADVFIDGYEKGNGHGGPWRNVVYLCKWDDSDTFMDALIGPAITWTGPGAQMFFPLPHRYPGNPRLLCTDVTARNGGMVQPASVPVGESGLPDPASSKMFSADFAFVTAHYEIPRYDVYAENPNVAFGESPVPWGEDSIRGYMNDYRIPAGVMAGDVSGDENDKALEFSMVHQEWSRSRAMMGYFFTDILDALVGTVNKDVIYGKLKGTMMLQPYTAVSRPQSDGTRVITLDYSWMWRSVDWNAEIAKDPPFRWEIQSDGGSPKKYRYPYADHTVLTTPDFSSTV